MDMSADQILEKLKEHDKHFKSISATLKEHNKHFDEQKGQNERFALEFQKHDDSLKELKAIIKDKHNEVLERSDEIILKLDRLETERLSANENIERLDKEVRKLGGFAS